MGWAGGWCFGSLIGCTLRSTKGKKKCKYQYQKIEKNDLKKAWME
jgi:hypothetical protein